MSFFNYDRFLKTVHIGKTLKVRFLRKEITELYQTAMLQKCEDFDFQKTYAKNFKGHVLIKENNKLGVVNDVFISPILCKKNHLVSGNFIKGKAVKSYNEKKKQ